MTDIVERLRRRRLPIDVGQFTIYEDDKECHEAADEIERLREDNDKLQRMLKMAATWTAEPGVTIAEIREVFSLLDRTALGEKE